jgi:hypothetical protein
MTSGMISISQSSTSLTYVVIVQLHLHMVYFYRSLFDMQETYDQFLVRSSLLTNKLMSQGFQLSRLQATIFNICPYNLSLDHMLSDMFHTNR